MSIVAETLSRLAVGAPVSHRGLSVLPLTAPAAGEPFYLTLDDALAAGSLRIGEVSVAGSVPELRVENRGERPVLLLDGEELVGAKQNRVLNVSVLAPPKATITVPVSCVEQRRWRETSRTFSSSGRAHHASGRAHRSESVSAAMRLSGERHSDQLEVWADIEAKAEQLAVDSATMAMADLYEHRRADLDRYAALGVAQPGQIGALFARRAQVVGLECFDCAPVLAKLLPKIVRSYALDALEDDAVPSREVGPDAAVAFLDRVRIAGTDAFPGVGLGTDLRVSGTGLAGGALAYEGRIVHLVAFDLGTPAGTDRSGIAGAWRAGPRRALRH
jgi:hypothetical protein